MPLYRDVAVVLRTQKLGEADRIVTLLTRAHGVVRAAAKGVRRTSSKFGARLEPFMVSDIQFYEGRTLDSVTQVVTLGAFGAQIAADYDRYAAGSVMLEAAARLGEGSTSPAQFELLAGAVRTLAAGRIAPGLVRDGYLLRALSLAGWTPLLDACAVCGARPGGEASFGEADHSYFSVPHGGVVCDSCRVPGLPRVMPGTLRLMRALLAGDWETAVASSPREQAEAAELIAVYVQYQLERSLRSLASTRDTHA